MILDYTVSYSSSKYTAEYINLEAVFIGIYEHNLNSIVRY